MQSKKAGFNAFLPKPILWPRLAAPPKEELLILLDLSQMGDMSAILERAAHIETMGEQYRAFADKLRGLVQGFDERELLALIRQCKEAAP